MKKQCYCSICGEDLGVMETWPRDLLSCGKPECDRELRDQERADQEEAAERAARDNYERYR